MECLHSPVVLITSPSVAQQRHELPPDAIRARRESRGLTQQAVADALGVGQTAVSQWERGQVTPTLRNVALLSRLLDCSIDDLYGAAA